ncbi:MAG: 4Fe-4S dicluster domain-containing protein [Phycisphaerae bacterium]|nr:4Fe-4S dicluster domain-containing protein [Phycisphaerae bacterium]NIR66859.1 4Fe-4S dicluster domain-containing protein [candidate division Zixibacteria bacterium]NIP51277.1 4Fe-4S dicluster domain-containing protein [Phycisphaerae bacterium]NIS54014.1 4Fe-4S dicluster domain-containing protein [Phycisphaerae bacterium]NIU11622.1 4Fe-4S dicluster domain-containing protein [Phycisphaerae bacterium]
MKFRGGYNVLLQGKPEGVVKPMPEPDKLYLPLRSERFMFGELLVKDGQDVQGGDALARDVNNHGVPLLAPRTGRVRLDEKENYIILEDVAKLEEHADMDKEELSHIEREMGAAGIKRYRLLSLGAWQFFYDAHTGELPDPLGTPQAIIVSTVSLEPFLSRGDAQLHNRLSNFTRGLEHLQSLLEYQPIYLIMPDIKSEFASLIRNHIRGYAWVKMLEVPLTYPYDSFAILARKIGLNRDKGPVWAVRTEGVLAIDRALTLSKPCMVRIISIGGAGINSPTHIKVMPGYPLKHIRDQYVFEPAARMINGGILTGQMLGEETLGIDTECRGITVLPELREREFLGFARPGWSRSCYAACYLSALRKKFLERFNTGMRGEGRPCISCNFCEDICPAGITPHLIHKYLYRDLVEEAEQARTDLCVECGLCSYVCPSKIDLRQQLIDAKKLIEQEKEEIRKEKMRQEELARKAAEEKNE